MLLITTLFASLALIADSAALPTSTTSLGAAADGLCLKPTTRLEWRSLSQTQKNHYTAAVTCLTTKPSKIGLNTTRYDDFPYIHSELNANSQNSSDPCGSTR